MTWEMKREVGRMARWTRRGSGRKQVRGRLKRASVGGKSYAWAAFCFLDGGEAGEVGAVITETGVMVGERCRLGL